MKPFREPICQIQNRWVLLIECVPRSYSITMEQLKSAGNELDFYECADATAHWGERARALDQWLEEQLPGNWTRVRNAVLVTSALEAVPPRELWSFFLCALEVAKCLAAGDIESATHVSESLAAKPPQPLRTLVRSEQTNLISIVPAHDVVQRALDVSWRSDIHGVSLVALPSMDISQSHADLLDQSLRVLREASPALMRLVQAQCAAVVLVSTQPPLAEQSAVSLTVKRIPGLVFLSEVPLLLFMEGLVHESVHLWLNGVERVRMLYIDSELRLMTPLRKDPRPISGLMHQAWVLLHLVQLHRDLGSHHHPILQSESRRQAKLLAEHTSDLEVALNSLEIASHALTDNGIAFVRGMRNRASQWG